MSHMLKRICNVLTTLIVLTVVILSILLVGVRAVKLTPLAVLSGSMEPVYKTGSIIYVKPISAVEVKVGDPITFKLSDNSTLATHRVVKIDSDNQLFYTKGDANTTEDANPVSFKNLIGTPVFTIPYFGYVADVISGEMGPYILIALAGVVIILYLIPGIVSNSLDKDVGADNQPTSQKVS